MIKHPSAALVLVTLVAALCTVLPAHAENNQAPGLRPVFQYSASSSEPVIEYNVVNHMLAQQDPVPLLRIYGNGRVHVHIPAYMKRAGDYELTMSSVELNELLRQLADDGILDFDPAAAKQEKQQLKAARRAASGELFHASDASDSHINIKLAQYQRSAASPRISSFSRQFRWRNLEFDAKNIPESVVIRKAANAEAILRMLCAHPALQKLP